MTPKQLQATRKRLELTQSQLAAKLGLSRDGIARMEAGRCPIRQITAAAIAHLDCKKQEEERL